MSNWIKQFILCSFILYSGIAQAKHKKIHPIHHHSKQPVSQAIIGSQALNDEINRIIAHTDKKASLSISIKSMTQGDSLYAKNAQQLLTPASTMKIMTAEAALLYLGANYQFETTLSTDATKMENGIINGNLYLTQSGDPSLTYNDLMDLIATLQSQHIKRVIGNVYIDTTAYDQSDYGPGWDGKDKSNCYAAPINASIINHNCLALQMVPGNITGKQANIIESPHYFYGTVTNDVITKRPHIHSCYIQLGITENNAISLSGCMPKGKYAWGFSTTIANVMAYNKSLFQNLFQHYGITIQGNIVFGPTPAHSNVIATHTSKPLNELITEMLKMSDNVIAGSLFKKMGELYSHQPGTWENGSLAVKNILQDKAAINLAEINIVDGSGLSRDNKINAAQILRLLDFAYHDAATQNDFITALPIAGIDGTLKHRLYNVSKRVQAKTGTMQGVTALAGYVVNHNETIAFAIIVNEQHANIWQYREMEDKIVTALGNFSR